MKNDLIFERERLISSAFIDSSLRLGIAEAALLMQDNLTECFSHLQCDGILYREKYNAFWVFTKMKLTFTERPRWLQSVKIATFPVSNEGMRTNINTAMYREDGMLFLAANLEACALDLTTHRPIKLASLPPIFPNRYSPSRSSDSARNSASRNTSSMRPSARSRLICPAT